MRTQWPMAAAAVAFLVVYSVQVIADTTPAETALLTRVIWLLWLVFLVDYVVNLVTAENRGGWFIRNLHELAVLLLPFLRPLRLLRLVTLVRIINRAAGSALRGRIVFYVVGSAALLAYAGALAVLDAEKEAKGANITTIGDALWWALTTITTVGYGDRYPVTEVGRFVALGLMIGGIAVLSVVTASVASWMVESVAAETTDEVISADQAVVDELQKMAAQIQELNARIAALSPKPASNGADTARRQPPGFS